MILEQRPSKGPDTSEDKVDLIKFSGRVGRSVVLSQQAFQQGTQSLIGKMQGLFIEMISKKQTLFSLCAVSVLTCTMLFSGIGVMVLRLQRTCSRQ